MESMHALTYGQVLRPHLGPCRGRRPDGCAATISPPAVWIPRFRAGWRGLCLGSRRHCRRLPVRDTTGGGGCYLRRPAAFPCHPQPPCRRW